MRSTCGSLAYLPQQGWRPPARRMVAARTTGQQPPARSLALQGGNILVRSAAATVTAGLQRVRRRGAPRQQPTAASTPALATAARAAATA
eukprot:scaffold93866_cov56-Phaeocystis_antarctica.AAC.2